MLLYNVPTDMHRMRFHTTHAAFLAAQAVGRPLGHKRVCLCVRAARVCVPAHSVQL